MRENKRMRTGLRLQHEAVRKKARQEPRKNICLRSSGEQDRSRIGAAAAAAHMDDPRRRAQKGKRLRSEERGERVAAAWARRGDETHEGGRVGGSACADAGDVAGSGGVLYVVHPHGALARLDRRAVRRRVCTSVESVGDAYPRRGGGSG